MIHNNIILDSGGALDITLGDNMLVTLRAGSAAAVFEINTQNPGTRERMDLSYGDFIGQFGVNVSQLRRDINELLTLARCRVARRHVPGIRLCSCDLYDMGFTVLNAGDGFIEVHKKGKRQTYQLSNGGWIHEGNPPFLCGKTENRNSRIWALGTMFDPVGYWEKLAPALSVEFNSNKEVN